MIEWVDQYAVEDDEFGKAYEAISPKERAVIKKSIAQLFDFYLKTSLIEGLALKFKRGFNLSLNSFPCKWGVILAHSRSNPSQIIAASVLAIMSEVENLFFVQTRERERKINELTLLGLELSGCNLAYLIPIKEIKKFLLNLLEKSPYGFLIVVGDDSFLVKIRKNIRDLGFFKCFFLNVCKKAFLIPEEEFDIDLIKRFNPYLDIKILKNIDKIDINSFEVGYISKDWRSKIPKKISYIFGPGQEGFWFWRELTPFMLREKSIEVWER